MKLGNFFNKLKLNYNSVVGFSIWIFLLFIWFLTANFNLINTAFFPTPEIFVVAVTKSEFWQAFGIDLLSTLSRFSLGLVIGVLLNYVLILVAFYLSGFYSFLGQLNKVLKYVPLPVVIPLNILFFGVNDLTIIFTAAFSSFILYLNFSISIIEKEEKNFNQIQKNWRIQPLERFREFYLPISSFLNYRIIPALLIWTMGMVLIAEIILGGKYGLGIRLLQYQQLYQTGNLFGVVILILLITFVLEFLFINFFARLKWDFIKIISTVLLGCLILSSFGYQAYLFIGSNSSNTKSKIVTYKAVINLPLFVYIEKFNTQNFSLETVASGTQAVDSLLSKKSVISGFGDIPNVVAAFNKNKNLQVVAQVVEKPNQPSLFLLSKPAITASDYSLLNNSRVGFYPNNPVIQKGLEFVAGLNKADSSSIEYIGSNDPNSLSQGLAANQLQAFLSLEPYISDAEKNFNLTRINPKETAIKGINFDNLPLAAVMIDKDQLSNENQSNFVQGLKKSVQFIKDNSTEDFKAKDELIKIMEKYGLNKNSSLSAFQVGKDINPQDLELLINLLSIFGVTKVDQDFDYNNFYRLND